jgi:hypothetical protein
MTTPQTDFQTRSFTFACLIVNLYRSLDEARTVPSYLARQVLRSGTSIGANLEEAKAAQSRPNPDRGQRARFSLDDVPSSIEARVVKGTLVRAMGTKFPNAIGSTVLSSKF